MPRWLFIPDRCGVQGEELGQANQRIHRFGKLNLEDRETGAGHCTVKQLTWWVLGRIPSDEMVFKCRACEPVLETQACGVDAGGVCNGRLINGIGWGLVNWYGWWASAKGKNVAAVIDGGRLEMVNEACAEHDCAEGVVQQEKVGAVA